jgi:hypothetical protein
MPAAFIWKIEMTDSAYRQLAAKRAEEYGMPPPSPPRFYADAAVAPPRLASGGPSRAKPPADALRTDVNALAHTALHGTFRAPPTRSDTAFLLVTIADNHLAGTVCRDRAEGEGKMKPAPGLKYRAWTAEDDDRLKSLIEASVSVDLIAAKMKWTTQGVRYRASTLGISTKRYGSG